MGKCRHVHELNVGELTEQDANIEGTKETLTLDLIITGTIDSKILNKRNINKSKYEDQTKNAS